GDFIDFFVERDAFLQILELHRTADFGENGVGVRIPLGQQLTKLDLFAVLDAKARAVNDLVALLFTTAIVENCQRTRAVHRDESAVLALDVVQIDEANVAVVLGIEARLVLHTAGSSADVEGTHSELRARLADGLRGYDAAGFAQFDHAAGAQVTPVAETANAAARFASEHRANLHLLNACTLNGRCDVFIDLLVHIDYHVSVVILDALERHAADDAIAHGFDDLARFNDRSDIDAFARSAVILGDDDVLRHVYQTTSQVARVRGLERGIGQSLTCAVRRDEVLEHREPFPEVRRDGRLDDFARGLCHQSTHARKLANLLLRTTGAGVGHDVDRVHGSF